MRTWQTLFVAIALVGAAELYCLLAPVAPLTAGPTGFRHTKHGGLCAGKLFVAYPSVVASDSISVPPVANANDWREYPVYVPIDTDGQKCDAFGSYVGMRHVNISLRTEDLTHPFNGTDV